MMARLLKSTDCFRTRKQETLSTATPALRSTYSSQNLQSPFHLKSHIVIVEWNESPLLTILKGYISDRRKPIA